MSYVISIITPLLYRYSIENEYSVTIIENTLLKGRPGKKINEKKLNKGN